MSDDNTHVRGICPCCEEFYATTLDVQYLICCDPGCRVEKFIPEDQVLM